MMQIHLNDTSQSLLFKQIVDQVRQAIATNSLQSGERLPTVRQLATSLGISPGTVLRAYRELGQNGVVQSRRGRGTVVVGKASDPRLRTLRQMHLSNMVSNTVLEALSLGYSLEEIEAAFSLHLDRWREERKGEGWLPSDPLPQD